MTSCGRIPIESKSVSFICFNATFCQLLGPLSLLVSYSVWPALYSAETAILISTEHSECKGGCLWSRLRLLIWTSFFFKLCSLCSVAVIPTKAFPESTGCACSDCVTITTWQSWCCPICHWVKRKKKFHYTTLTNFSRGLEGASYSKGSKLVL